MKNVFFDLDGTLLPMNQNDFIYNYVKKLSLKMAKNGYDANKFAKDLLHGTELMLKNNGNRTNEEIFWSYFNKDYNLNIIDIFNDYYDNEYKDLKNHTFYTEYSSQIVRMLNEKGYNVFLTTNPIFPLNAVLERLSWVGLKADDFKYITTYENSSFAKPKLEYFKEVLDKFNLNAKDTIMIGNDVSDDFGCLSYEFKKLLITDYALNLDKLDFEIEKTNLEGLLEMVKAL